ncbi:lanthionine synthetase LanC family protein [Sphaerisporangium rubeum]|uniref:Lantibiotic modifying enzyme n=1 Tax=Sphaerisporangium rubeum TaxID=321317 RepID=A0A7X0IJ42_9ACTN|nr:lanthionine synthetase LanC family protein [Sphaerisporangium rubeum]MBB6474642.1 lantibiotic modifying enzyme [Sphaerisporangium rubeum]
MGELTGIGPGELLEQAERVAGVIAATAITADGQATWLSASAEPGVARTGDVTLYEGSAGVAWSLAGAAGVLDDARLAGLSVQAARHAVERAPRRAPGPGLYDGLAGIGLAAMAIGDPGLAKAGGALLDTAATLPPQAADLVGGAAGTIVALMATGRHERAVHLGHRLAAMAVRRPWGCFWPDPGEPIGLCGLAHGVAGIVWALAELRHPELDEVVEEGLRYERSWFDPVSGNWPDLRPGASGRRPAMWCHGAAGIGLGRLGLFRTTRHPSAAAEAAVALQVAAADAEHQLSEGVPARGLTLCHGLGGTVELLLTAHEILGEPEHLAAARWILAAALESLGPDPRTWPGGGPDAAGSMGLMTGLAGTLYLLVRAAHPDRLASVGLPGGAPPAG